MTATAHALVGGAIAASIYNPALGLPLAFISHPILDMIPHWDFGIGWRGKNKLTLFLESILDLSLGIFLSFILFGQNINLVYFLSCILVSEIWDIMMMPRILFNWNFPPFSTFYAVQHALQIKAKANLPWGILTQAVSVYATILLLRLVPQFAH